MKSKKIILIFVAILILIIIAGYFGIKYVKERNETSEINEYTPEQEITEEQYRQTIVTLYYVDKETSEIKPEARMVDIKEIMNNPYEKILNLLLEGPKNENLISVIPQGTKLNNVTLDGNCLIIDFSSEILNFENIAVNLKDNLINCIVNTVTELTEVNEVRFLVDGGSVEDFGLNYTRQ